MKIELGWFREDGSGPFLYFDDGDNTPGTREYVGPDCVSKTLEEWEVDIQEFEDADGILCWREI